MINLFGSFGALLSGVVAMDYGARESWVKSAVASACAVVGLYFMFWGMQ